MLALRVTDKLIAIVVMAAFGLIAAAVAFAILAIAL
jgi:hypothetical protein